MKKLLGIFTFLLILYIFILIATNPEYWGENHFNLAQRIGLSGILTLGAGVLIITGGVDLSMGSVLAFCACVFCWLVLERHVPIPLAAVLVLVVGGLIGLVNGLLVTYLRVQAFVVTLCGLFIYRGAARWLARDQKPLIASHVAGLNDLFGGEFLSIPIYLWLLLALFALTSVFLHFTIWGRYFYAIGSNERAARYSGIAVNFYKILAYVFCSTFAAIYSLMHVIEYKTVEPSVTGNSMELAAIAAAVVGGCSLRGGEGTSLGMFIGTAILTLLPNLTGMWGIPDSLEPIFVGGALLICAGLDELLRRDIGWRDILAALRIMRRDR
jgi:ribose transport system permease protein